MEGRRFEGDLGGREREDGVVEWWARFNFVGVLFD